MLGVQDRGRKTETNVERIRESSLSAESTSVRCGNCDDFSHRMLWHIAGPNPLE